MGRTSSTERIARALMAHYHPELKQTWGERPNWLKNPETGQNLELDIQFKEIQCALEIDGAQHGRPIKGLQKHFADFEKQQRHDALKSERCFEYGVKLYRLTIHDLTQRRFEYFLKRFEEENRLLPNRMVYPPLELFQEAEKLSRRKIVRTPEIDVETHRTIEEAIRQNRKPSGWQRFLTWMHT